MNMIQFENALVDAWKVRKGTVVMLDCSYYHVDGFVLNDKLSLIDSLINKPVHVSTREITWIEPH